MNVKNNCFVDIWYRRPRQWLAEMFCRSAAISDRVAILPEAFTKLENVKTELIIHLSEWNVDNSKQRKVIFLSQWGFKQAKFFKSSM